MMTVFIPLNTPLSMNTLSNKLLVCIILVDRTRIGFGNITFSVREGAGFAELPVTVLGTATLGGEVTVRFSTSDISAKG